MEPEAIPLPPLPTGVDAGDWFGSESLYTADHMHDYARAAVLADRYVIDLLVAAGHVSASKVEEARQIAAAIRSGTAPAQEK